MAKRRKKEIQVTHESLSALLGAFQKGLRAKAKKSRSLARRQLTSKPPLPVMAAMESATFAHACEEMIEDVGMIDLDLEYFSQGDTIEIDLFPGIVFVHE